MKRSQLVTEVTGLKAHINDLSPERTTMVENRDRMRQQLADRVSREAQIRQRFAGWSNEGSSGGSGNTAAS